MNRLIRWVFGPSRFTGKGWDYNRVPQSLSNPTAGDIPGIQV